jgi:cathepsin L
LQTNAEYQQMYLRSFNGSRTGETFVQGNEVDPASVDWRTQGYVTPIKDQGQCGSCWSFSSTGSIEGAHFKSTGKLVSFSEQNLVDCSTSEGNQGCNGGLMDYAFTYVIKTGGLDTEASYPYTARDGTCKYNPANSGGTISKYVDVTAGSEAALQSALATVGPISVAIDASHNSFQFYKTGVYNEPTCSSKNVSLSEKTTVCFLIAPHVSASSVTNNGSSTTVSSLLAMVSTLARTTGSSRTAGEPLGATRATS